MHRLASPFSIQLLSHRHRVGIYKSSIVLIGVGRNDWFHSPLPPNRTGGSPASGSPVDGSPRGGLDETTMGRVQAVQPMCVEVGIGPTLVVRSPRTAASFAPLAKYASQAPANPAVQVSKH